jgi:hypothetical protein
MRNPDPITPTLIAASDTETIQQAVTTPEPGHDIARQELAWWLALQERPEIRAELTAHGLL